MLKDIFYSSIHMFSFIRIIFLINRNREFVNLITVNSNVILYKILHMTYKEIINSKALKN